MSTRLPASRLRLRRSRSSVVVGRRYQNPNDLFDVLDRIPIAAVIPACERWGGNAEQCGNEQRCDNTAHSSPPVGLKPCLWFLIGGRAPVQGVVMEEGKVLPTTLRVVEEKCAQARSEAALDMF